MTDAAHSEKTSAHPIDDRVRALMDRRLESARELADAASELASTKAAFEEAQRVYASRFKDAEKAGWDRRELTGPLGMQEPPRAPRARRGSKQGTAGTGASGSDSGGGEQPSS